MFVLNIDKLYYVLFYCMFIPSSYLFTSNTMLCFKAQISSYLLLYAAMSAIFFLFYFTVSRSLLHKSAIKASACSPV